MAAKLVWVNTGKKVGECDQSGNFIVRDAPRELELWDDKGKICSFGKIEDFDRLQAAVERVGRIENLECQIENLRDRLRESMDELEAALEDQE